MRCSEWSNTFRVQVGCKVPSPLVGEGQDGGKCVTELHPSGSSANITRLFSSCLLALSARQSFATLPARCDASPPP
jgi:hypothetical protein